VSPSETATQEAKTLSQPPCNHLQQFGIQRTKGVEYFPGGFCPVSTKIARVSVVVLAILVVSAVTVSCTTRFKPPRNAKESQRTLLTTGYCKCGMCTNWKRNWRLKPVVASGPRKGKRKDVGITATGTRAKPGTIAADTSLYPFGTVMFIPGYGYGRVEDVGSAIKGNHIDLYFNSHEQALKWGKKNRKVKVWARR